MFQRTLRGRLLAEAMPVGQRLVANDKCLLVGCQLTRLQLLMLTTNLPESVRQSNSEEAVSVIHAPESFASWVCSVSLWDVTKLTPSRLLQHR